MPRHKSQRGGDRRSGKKYEPNAMVYTLTCNHDQLSFVCARPDAKYCSPRCRSAAARWRKARARYLAQVEANVRAAKERDRPKKKGKKPRH